MRRTTPLAHLAANGAGDHVAGQQLRRAARVGTAVGDHGLNPPHGLFFGFGKLAAEHLGNPLEHETFAFAINEHAPFAADALGD